MSDSSDIEKLLHLKRYESPGEEYFEKFAEDFKDRQRSEMLQQSSVTLLGERVTQFVSGMGPAKWAVPAGAAAAAIAGGMFVFNPLGTISNEQHIVQEIPVLENENAPRRLVGSSSIDLDLPKAKDTKTSIPGISKAGSGQLVPVGMQGGPYREF